MTPDPIILRKLERRGSECLVYVEEVVRAETVSHILSFDERSFSELEQVFLSHPFPKKSATDDVVIFRSLENPLEESRKYLGLLISNSGSRKHMKIPVTEEVFREMKAVLDSWSMRFKEPIQSPQTRTTIHAKSTIQSPSSGSPV